jgi:hypothetical protein
MFTIPNVTKRPFCLSKLRFPSVIKYQPYNAISPSFCCKVKKHRVREIIFPALRGYECIERLAA